MSRSIVYTTDVKDATSRLPVAVVDSAALPDDGSLPDPATEVPDLIAQLPKTGDFVIVYFASRSPKAPHMGWMRRVHSSLSQDLKKRIKKVYILHAKWYSRALNRTLAPIVSPKFALKIHHIGSLADLAREMDITAIDINPQIYLDDIDRTDSDITGSIPVPKHNRSVFGMPLTDVPVSYWRAAFMFLSKSQIDSSDFVPLSQADSESAALSAVLMHAVTREQRLRLYDFGPFPVLAVIKEYLLSLPSPLIRFADCPLPVHDTPEYLNDVLTSLSKSHLVHLRDMVEFGQNCNISPSIVASSLGPAAMGFVNPSREKAAISVRVFRILLTFWSPKVTHDAGNKTTSSSAPPLPPRRVSDSSSTHTDEVYGLETRPMPLQTLYSLSQPTASPYSFEERVPTVKGPMPRELPSEVLGIKKRAYAPNRRAYGKVAEIMRLYNDDR